MASRSNHQAAGYDQYGGSHQSPLPPPPPRDVPYTSPLRRQHALLPPVLTPNGSMLQGNSSYSTPLSSISHHQSPWSAVPPSPMITTTPIGFPTMPSRTTTQFSVPYDPRHWAPGQDARVAQLQQSRENAAEDGLASPPPPYSAEGGRSPREGVERSHTMSAAHSTPLAEARPQRRVGSTSHAPPQNRHSIHMGTYTIPLPPPPGTVPPLPRSRIVSDTQPVYDVPTAQVENNIPPPSARRAASASADVYRGAEAGPSRSASQQRNWTTGMPLPGPPPGPPPSTSRSQSTSAALDRSIQPQARSLRQTMHTSDLGAIPPTPLTWSEGQPLPENDNSVPQPDASRRPSASYSSPLNSQTRRTSLYYDGTTNTPQSRSDGSFAESSSANLSRSSAVRDNSTKGLRERRAQNRNSKIFDGDINGLSVQTNPWASAMQTEPNDQQQDAPTSSGPRSGGRLQPKSPSPLAVVMSNQGQFSASPIQMSGTPPLSPNPAAQQHQLAARSAGLPAKSLPTPPLSQKPPSSAHGVLQSSRLSLNTGFNNQQTNFQEEAIRRHNDFLEKEKQAKSDIERLQLFAEFVLREASLRRQKYEVAFQSGGFDVEKLRTNLFNSTKETRSASNSISQVSTDSQDPATGNTTPQTRPETMWWKDYQPALSPIASMDYDEMSSRGRAPSRWWESQTGSQNGETGGRPVHRSKRESKYMGLSKEFLMAHSPNEEYPIPYNQSVTIPSINTYPPEKANPETFGYFEESTPRKLPAAVPATKRPETPALLDISRFITLPPPYPRHYPAVNNNHPDLAQYRTTVRTLGDLEEITNRKTKHKANEETLRNAHQRRMSESRRSFKANIQAQIANGHITYKEAAAAEEACKMSEFESEKQQLQAEFDQLQDTVINPLHDMLHGRLSQLDSNIDKLLNDLHTDASHQDPDQPQEEGDEKPELLEKLTQLKWLFDLREQIHRECFELMSERNNKFKAIVLLPYRFAMNNDKVRDTESFFDKDGQTRFMAYCQESLKRHESFLQTIEQHVRRGVELQSSAFWDIAPGLLDLIQKIPEDLRHFEGIQIPDKEYKENPSYVQHPQQYLYSLLSHAEKSTYQYIEGQVNLQCLHHEVKTGLLGARYKSLEAEEGHPLSDSKAQEEAALTAELKQKASMIEQQWLEALGSQLHAIRERVKSLLQEDDAWEEIAAEDA